MNSVTSQQQIISGERRSGIERRSQSCSYDFPYIDGHGDLVITDRRRNSDRRNTNCDSNSPPITIESKTDNKIES